MYERSGTGCDRMILLYQDFIIEFLRLTSREREGETKNMKNSTEMYLKASSVAEIEDFHMFICIYHALNYCNSLN